MIPRPKASFCRYTIEGEEVIKPEDLLVVIYKDIKDGLMRGKTVMPTYIEVEYNSDSTPYVLKEVERVFNAFTKPLELFPSVEIYVIRIRDEHDIKHEYYYIINKATKRSYLVNNRGIFYDLLIYEYYKNQDALGIFSFLIDSWLEEHFEKIEL